MPKGISRIVAVFLVACLIADPTLATSLPSAIAHRPVVQTSASSRFQEEALAALDVAAYTPPEGKIEAVSIRKQGHALGIFGLMLADDFLTHFMPRMGLEPPQKIMDWLWKVHKNSPAAFERAKATHEARRRSPAIAGSLFTETFGETPSPLGQWFAAWEKHIDYLHQRADFNKSLSKNELKTKEASDILEKAKKALISIEILPQHLQRQIENTTVIVADDAPTFGEVYFNNPLSAERPYILLNTRFVETLTPAQLAWVIGHELGHIRLWDAEFTRGITRIFEEDFKLGWEIEKRADIFGTLVMRRLFPQNVVEIATIFHYIRASAPYIPERPNHLKNYERKHGRDYHMTDNQRAENLSDWIATPEADLLAMANAPWPVPLQDSSPLFLSSKIIVDQSALSILNKFLSPTPHIKNASYEVSYSYRLYTGYLAIIVKMALIPMLQHALGVAGAVVIFAIAHTVVEWVIRAKDQGWEKALHPANFKTVVYDLSAQLCFSLLFALTYRAGGAVAAFLASFIVQNAYLFLINLNFLPNGFRTATAATAAPSSVGVARRAEPERPAPPGGSLTNETDGGIASNGQGGQTRAEHLEFHKQGKFREIVEANVQKLRDAGIYVPRVGTLGGYLWYDFRAAVDNAFSQSKAKFIVPPDVKIISQREARVNLHIEPDGIVVLIDPDLAEDHAGRSGMVMARNEAMARHELAELRELAQWAVNRGFADDVEVANGKLGVKIRAWLNDGIDATTKLEREREFAEASAFAHDIGIAAQNHPEVRLSPEGYHLKFGKGESIHSQLRDEEIAKAEDDFDGIIHSSEEIMSADEERLAEAMAEKYLPNIDLFGRFVGTSFYGKSIPGGDGVTYLRDSVIFFQGADSLGRAYLKDQWLDKAVQQRVYERALLIMDSQAPPHEVQLQATDTGQHFPFVGDVWFITAPLVPKMEENKIRIWKDLKGRFWYQKMSLRNSGPKNLFSLNEAIAKGITPEDAVALSPDIQIRVRAAASPNAGEIEVISEESPGNRRNSVGVIAVWKEATEASVAPATERKRVAQNHFLRSVLTVIGMVVWYVSSLQAQGFQNPPDSDGSFSLLSFVCWSVVIIIGAGIAALRLSRTSEKSSGRGILKHKYGPEPASSLTSDDAYQLESQQTRQVVLAEIPLAGVKLKAVRKNGPPQFSEVPFYLKEGTNEVYVNLDAADAEARKIFDTLNGKVYAIRVAQYMESFSALSSLVRESYQGMSKVAIEKSREESLYRFASTLKAMELDREPFLFNPSYAARLQDAAPELLKRTGSLAAAHLSELEESDHPVLALIELTEALMQLDNTANYQAASYILNALVDISEEKSLLGDNSKEVISLISRLLENQDALREKAHALLEEGLRGSTLKFSEDETHTTPRGETSRESTDIVTALSIEKIAHDLLSSRGERLDTRKEALRKATVSDNRVVIKKSQRLVKEARHQLEAAERWASDLQNAQDPLEFLHQQYPLSSQQVTYLEDIRHYALPRLEVHRVFFVQPDSILAEAFDLQGGLGITVGLEDKSGKIERICLINATPRPEIEMVKTVIHEYLHVWHMPPHNYKTLFEGYLHEGLTEYFTRKILLIALKSPSAWAERLKNELRPLPKGAATWEVVFLASFNEESGNRDNLEFVDELARVVGEKELHRLYEQNDFASLFLRFPNLEWAKLFAQAILSDKSSLSSYTVLQQSKHLLHTPPLELGGSFLEAILTFVHWFNYSDGELQILDAIHREVVAVGLLENSSADFDVETLVGSYLEEELNRRDFINPWIDEMASGEKTKEVIFREAKETTDELIHVIVASYVESVRLEREKYKREGPPSTPPTGGTNTVLTLPNTYLAGAEFYVMPYQQQLLHEEIDEMLNKLQQGAVVQKIKETKGKAFQTVRKVLAKKYPELKQDEDALDERAAELQRIIELYYAPRYEFAVIDRARTPSKRLALAKQHGEYLSVEQRDLLVWGLEIIQQAIHAATAGLGQELNASIETLLEGGHQHGMSTEALGYAHIKFATDTLNADNFEQAVKKAIHFLYNLTHRPVLTLDPPTPWSVAVAVRYATKQLGYSERYLARAIGVSRHDIADPEHASANVRGRILAGIEQLPQDPAPSTEELRTALKQLGKQYAGDRDFERALGVSRSTILNALLDQEIPATTRRAIWEKIQGVDQNTSTVNLLKIFQEEVAKLNVSEYQPLEQIIGVDRKTIKRIIHWQPIKPPPHFHAKTLDQIRHWLEQQGALTKLNSEAPNPPNTPDTPPSSPTSGNENSPSSSGSPSSGMTSSAAGEYLQDLYIRTLRYYRGTSEEQIQEMLKTPPLTNDIPGVSNYVPDQDSGAPNSVFDPLAKKFLGEDTRAYVFYTVAVASLWETAAFSMHHHGWGILWATFGFALAHTIVTWIVRAKEQGLREAFSIPNLKQDAKDFGARLLLSGLFIAPFYAFSHIISFWVSDFLHGLWNYLVIHDLLPDGLRGAPVATLFSSRKPKAAPSFSALLPTNVDLALEGLKEFNALLKKMPSFLNIETVRAIAKDKNFLIGYLGTSPITAVLPESDGPMDIRSKTIARLKEVIEMNPNFLLIPSFTGGQPTPGSAYYLVNRAALNRVVAAYSEEIFSFIGPGKLYRQRLTAFIQTEDKIGDDVLREKLLSGHPTSSAYMYSIYRGLMRKIDTASHWKPGERAFARTKLLALESGEPLPEKVKFQLMRLLIGDDNQPGTRLLTGKVARELVKSTAITSDAMSTFSSYDPDDRRWVEALEKIAREAIKKAQAQGLLTGVTVPTGLLNKPIISEDKGAQRQSNRTISRRAA